jgi:hypothetical protein
MVVDDMTQAEDCPIAMAVFPKGKSRGVMSYAEIGASLVCGNTLITVDEDENPDILLKKLTKPEHYFTDLDTAVEYLSSNPQFPANGRNHIISKYPAGTTEPVPCHTIYFCGTIDKQMRGIIMDTISIRPDKEYIVGHELFDYSNFLDVEGYDLIVANFPGNQDWDRHACLMLGAAYPHDISTIVMDQHKVKYPPLQALARRQMGPLDMMKYISRVDDLRIESESLVMYNLFKEELEAKAGETDMDDDEWHISLG